MNVSSRRDRRTTPDEVAAPAARPSLFSGRSLLIQGLIVLLCALLGGAAAWLVAEPRRSAESRLIVGTQDLGAQRIPYYSTATITLAETYARYLMEGGLSTSTDAQVEASAVPGTPVVRIVATAATQEQATAAAQEASRLLVERVGEAGAERTGQLEEEFRDTSQTVATLRSGAEGGTPEQTAELRLAELRLEALGNSYRDAYSAEVAPATDLQVVQDAMPVTVGLQQPVLLGALAGAMLAGLVLVARAALQHTRRV